MIEPRSSLQVPAGLEPGSRFTVEYAVPATPVVQATCPAAARLPAAGGASAPGTEVHNQYSTTNNYHSDVRWGLTGPNPRHPNSYVDLCATVTTFSVVCGIAFWLGGNC